MTLPPAELDIRQTLLVALQLLTFITQCHRIAKSVGCFQRRLFVCVCFCQHDNFRMSKHRMMKLGGSCIDIVGCIVT